jgi:predicted ArsR family transcriptional regulator
MPRSSADGGASRAQRTGSAPAPSEWPDAETRAARLLADPTRRTLHDTLLAAGGPMTVAELTGVAGVHHTAVRQHLKALRDAGLVDEDHDAPRGRGRPRLLYRARPAGRVATHYRELAGLLARAVSTGRPVRDIGREHGARLAGELTLPEGATGPLDVMAAVAASLGFDPTVDPIGDHEAHVVLRHCPYADVVVEDPATVCELHLGIAEGAAAASGATTVAGLEVRDPRQAGCRIRLDMETAGQAQPARSPAGHPPSRRRWS